MAVLVLTLLYGGAGSDMIYAESTDDVVNGWLATYDDTIRLKSLTALTGVLKMTLLTIPMYGREHLKLTNDPDAVDTVSYEKLVKKGGVTVTLDLRWNNKH